jgi:hypothetical protein
VSRLGYDLTRLRHFVLQTQDLENLLPGRVCVSGIAGSMLGSLQVCTREHLATHNERISEERRYLKVDEQVGVMAVAGLACSFTRKSCDASRPSRSIHLRRVCIETSLTHCNDYPR